MAHHPRAAGPPALNQFQHVCRLRLTRIGDQECLLLGHVVHTRANSKVVWVLSAAVQHDHHGERLASMDELLRDDPALFERYALNDAIIAAKYLDLTWSALEKNFAIGDHKPTLGSVGVEMIKREVANLGLTPDDYFGYRREGRKRHYHDALVDIWPFASNAYHGGRNEAFWLGHTPEGVALYDLDLKGAYTTAMAMLRIPDWQSAAPETRIERLAVVDQAMTFARVRFDFPAATRFPSLPVRAAERGLVYPLRGTSWCTGPEIVVALKQGADLHVEAGWRVEWIEGSSSPFEAFSRSISRIRQQAKVDNDQLRNQLAKEIGNSAYGKIAQAVECSRTVHDGGVDAARGKRVFDSREGVMKTLPGSAITNPMFAATTTGLVRAVGLRDAGERAARGQHLLGDDRRLPELHVD